MRQNEIPTDFCFLIFRPLLAGPWRLQGLEAPPQTLKALPLDPVTRELRGVVSLPSLALGSSSVSVFPSANEPDFISTPNACSAEAKSLLATAQFKLDPRQG